MSAREDLHLLVAVHCRSHTRYVTPAAMKNSAREPAVYTFIDEMGRCVPSNPYCAIDFRPAANYYKGRPR